MEGATTEAPAPPVRSIRSEGSTRSDARGVQTERGTRRYSHWRFPRVSAADLGGCRQVRDEGVGALCGSLTGLTSLNLGGCTLVSDEGVRILSKVTTLTSLDLSRLGSRLDGQLTEEGVRMLGSLGALHCLHLSRCTDAVTDNVVRGLCGSLTRLTSLNLAYCDHVTDDGIRTLSSLTALTSLNLNDCWEVSDDGIRTL
eukprot:410563-Pyramimonas_sp.AAC.1